MKIFLSQGVPKMAESKDSGAYLLSWAHQKLHLQTKWHTIWVKDQNIPEEIYNYDIKKKPQQDRQEGTVSQYSQEPLPEGQSTHRRIITTVEFLT